MARRCIKDAWRATPSTTTIWAPSIAAWSGRPAGSVADYNYTAALKNSGLTWDEATLDRWLTNPSALVPGTKMFFKIDDAQARADIIAYLKELR